MNAVLSRRGRDLVDAPQFERLAARVATDHPDVAELAPRIVDQALAFVATAARLSEGGLRPSTLVDYGWHELIDDPVAYGALCARLGRYVHHVPDDGPADATSVSAPSGEVARTLEAIEQAGYVVDPEMWPRMAKCTTCHEEGGCSSGGKDGNENSDTRKPPPR